MVLGNKPVTSKKEFGKLDSFLHIQYFRLINVEQIFTLFWFLLQVWPSLGNKKIRKNLLVNNNLSGIKEFCSQPNVKLNNGTKENFTFKFCSSHTIIFWSVIFVILIMENNSNNIVPRIGLGTYNMSSEEAEEMTYAAIDYGYRHIDLSLIHIWRCRRLYSCRSRWSPYH